jgi:two-component system, OmpR family, response regulator VicR
MNKEDVQMKILIVEDDHTIAAGLEYTLQQEQYETIICSDFQSAERLIELNLEQFDLSYSHFISD